LNQNNKFVNKRLLLSTFGENLVRIFRALSRRYRAFFRILFSCPPSWWCSCLENTVFSQNKNTVCSHNKNTIFKNTIFFFILRKYGTKRYFLKIKTQYLKTQYFFYFEKIRYNTVFPQNKHTIFSQNKNTIFCKNEHHHTLVEGIEGDLCILAKSHFIPKRALYIPKRALCILNRALYILKRALYFLKRTPCCPKRAIYFAIRDIVL